ATPESSWQVTDVASAPAVNATLTEVLAISAPLAGDVIVRVGAVASTLKLTEAAPALPAASVAVTVTVCVASVRPVYAFGLEHALAAPPSRLQVTEVTELVASVAVNATETVLVLNDWFGVGDEIATTGATESITNVWLAGDGSTPAEVTARTS